MKWVTIPQEEYDSMTLEISRLEALRAPEMRQVLLDLFEEGEPAECSRSAQCFGGGGCGRGAYETPEENMAGGCWFRECSCISEAQQKAAQILDATEPK